MWRIDCSRDQCCHVTYKGQGRDTNMSGSIIMSGDVELRLYVTLKVKVIQLYSDKISYDCYRWHWTDSVLFEH